MDNFSENNNQIEEQASAPENVPQTNTGIDDDIQFEENFDIEALQKQLMEKIEQSDSEEPPVEPPTPIIQNAPAQKKTNADTAAKKYVIYIESNNIEFMENLSNQERRDIINKILKEQNEITIQKKAIERKKQLIINVFLACITFVICFPVLFYMVNKSTEISITNYNQTKENFSKLYKQKGKIKSQSSTLINE